MPQLWAQLVEAETQAGCSEQPGEQLEHTEHLYGFRVKLLQSCPTPCDPLDHNSPTALSMGFSRQEYWSGLLSPTPEDLPNPRIEPTSLYI